MKRSFCLFTGLGGANVGLRQAGYQDLGGIEINQNVAAIHDLNFEQKVMVGDVLSLASKTPLVDLLWASPPCQSFSLANPNRGETELEINLAYAICASISRSKATEVIIENVPDYLKSISFSIITSFLKSEGFEIQTSILTKIS